MVQIGTECPHCGRPDPETIHNGNVGELQCCDAVVEGDGNIISREAWDAGHGRLNPRSRDPTFDVETCSDDELVTEIINAYEGREWGELMLFAAEADSRGITRKLGFSPRVQTVEDRLRRAFVHLRSVEQDIPDGEAGLEQVQASLRLVKQSLRVRRDG